MQVKRQMEIDSNLAWVIRMLNVTDFKRVTINISKNLKNMPRELKENTVSMSKQMRQCQQKNK